MNLINNEKKYPTLVEVVNQNGTSENPTKVEVSNFPTADSGQSIRVNVSNSLLSLRPANGSTFTVQLDNILLLQSNGGFFAVPLNSIFTGVSAATITSILESYKTAYSMLTSGITSATLHYSKFTNQNVVTSEVYNLKD